MSNLRVLVQWKNSTVHAGDDVECIITFKNICPSIDSHQSVTELPSTALGQDSWTRQLSLSLGQSLPRRPPSQATKNLRLRGGYHRSTRSYDTSLSFKQAPGYNVQSQSSKKLQDKTQKSHKRSVSIVSIGVEGLPLDKSLASFSPVASKRPNRAHDQALSFQALPRANLTSIQTLSGKQLQLFNPQCRYLYLSGPISLDAIGTSSPLYNGQFSILHPLLPLSLKFRADTIFAGAKSSPEVKHFDSATLESSQLPAPDGATCSSHSSATSPRVLSPQLYETTADMLQIDPMMSSLPSVKQNETARSSGDSHFMSTSSTDTFVSEYPIGSSNRSPWKGRPGHDSSLPKCSHPSPMTEVLMMGFAQITGYFTIDGSLIKQQPFEHVKRKYVISGQRGGGIIRGEKREQNGLFSNLRWGNLGESITGILGGGEPGSMKNSKDGAGLRSIPILSTPQSVLFVDLKIEPGQSITYTYRCPLPSAIPPTHKGRAMKVNYHLTIGIQRATIEALKQQISTVHVPFRVTTGVTGETSLQMSLEKANRRKERERLCPTISCLPILCSMIRHLSPVPLIT